MGVPWISQIRTFHLSVLALAMLTFILYVTYLSTSQISSTVSPIKYYDGGPILNDISRLEGVKNTSAVPNGPSEAPPASKVDLSRGVPASLIYEAGHLESDLEICKNKGIDLKLLIMITSAPGHDSNRMAIRETWGHFSIRKEVAIAFMLGSTSNKEINASLSKENLIYGDLIRGNFIDTYDNLTLKTISTLEWVDTYCPKVAYVLKTDDDMFINVGKLLTYISKQKQDQRAIYGRLAKKWKPIRNKKSKYYISPQQYKPTIFPDFTTGPAYLFPAHISKDLYNSALRHTYFKLEDVFITGIVADSLKIKRIHAADFLNKRVSLTPCNVQRGISIHMIKGLEQYDLWKKLHDTTAKCK